MKERYAVCHFKHGWLTDADAGGTYSYEEADACTFDTPGDAQTTMTLAELGKLGRDYEIVPLVDVWKPMPQTAPDSRSPGN